MPSRSSSTRYHLPHTSLPLFCFSVFLAAFLLSIVAVFASTFFFHPSSHILHPTFTSHLLPPPTSNSILHINVTDVESVVAQFEDPSLVPEPDTRLCRTDEPIDCRDPDVFHSLMTAAIRKFKDIHFYRFGKPVKGDNQSCCHMAWRFKPKQGEATKFFKDYRAFTVVRFHNCTISVVGIGDYHSGARARKPKSQSLGNVKDITSIALEVGDSSTSEIVESSEDSFSRGKYLIYSGGGDRCKSMNQYLWSFMCMLGEALYLNRTLVMDFSICLSKIYSSSGVDEEGKDFRFYFDLHHLREFASVIGQPQFWSEWNKWQGRNGLSLHLVEDSNITPMKLAGVKDTLIMRKFGSVEPDNYWYRVCEGEVDHVVNRPWHMIWKSRRLLDVASAIATSLNWDFDSVRVQREEKASNKEVWPNLNTDGQSEAVLKTLKNKIEDGRNLYIATTEADASFLKGLKDKNFTHFLDDYKHLWDANSDWNDDMMKLNSGNSVEFDGYMRISVDTEVFLRGKRQIDMFNDPVGDCKDDISKCIKIG